MTTFLRTWNASYLASPADSDNASEGATRIRNFKTDIGERFGVEHSLAGDANDGKHLQTTYKVQGSDPTLDAGDAAIYSKTADGNTRLFGAGAHAGGAVIQLFPAGIVLPFAGATLPGNFLACDGATYDSVASTEYAPLFAAIGTTWGGTGAAAFKVPDFRGRGLMADGTGSYSDTFTAIIGSGAVTLGSTSIDTWFTGQLAVLTTTGTLPTNLNAGMYVIRVGDTTLRFATTLANALSNTYVATPDNGTGIHTVTLNLIPRTVGQRGGQEDHLISSVELPSHTHDIFTGSNDADFGGVLHGDKSLNDAKTEITGSATAMNILQPFAVVKFGISF